MLMKTTLNLWSFVLSLFCFALFLSSVSSSIIVEFVSHTLHIHPLHIVLGLTLVTLIICVIGFSGINSWKSALRSAVSILLTIGMSVMIPFILALGNLFT
jgi:hypothetical protein